MKCYFKQDDVVRKKADELEEKYEVRRTSIGDATILNRGYVKKEYFYIQNLNELLKLKKAVKESLKEYHFDHCTVETELDKESCGIE